MKTRKKPRANVKQKKLPQSANAVKNKVIRKAPKPKAKITKKISSNSQAPAQEIDNFETLQLKYLELLKKVEILEEKVNQGPAASTSQQEPKKDEPKPKAQAKPVPRKLEAKRPSIGAKKKLSRLNSKARRSLQTSDFVARRLTRQNIAELKTQPRVVLEKIELNKIATATSKQPNNGLAKQKNQPKVSSSIGAEVDTQETKRPQKVVTQQNNLTNNGRSRPDTSKTTNQQSDQFKLVNPTTLKKYVRTVRIPVKSPPNKTCRIVRRVNPANRTCRIVPRVKPEIKEEVVVKSETEQFDSFSCSSPLDDHNYDFSDRISPIPEDLHTGVLASDSTEVSDQADVKKQDSAISASEGNRISKKVQSTKQTEGTPVHDGVPDKTVSNKPASEISSEKTPKKHSDEISVPNKDKVLNKTIARKRTNGISNEKTSKKQGNEISVADEDKVLKKTVMKKRGSGVSNKNTPKKQDSRISDGDEVLNKADAEQDQSLSEQPPMIIYLSAPNERLPLHNIVKQDSAEKFDFQFKTGARYKICDELSRTMCRVCGRYNVECVQIFEEGSQIAKLMKTFLPLENLTEKDPLPLTICLDCAGVLQATDDLAFRCLIVEPLFRPAANSTQPNIIGMIDVMEEGWRNDVNIKVIDKFMTTVPTIQQRLESRCVVSETIVETCNICGQRDMRCLETCEEHLFMSIINTYLPFEFSESKRDSFHACLECVGTLQVMDDLSFRFFNVESCLREHYRICKFIDVNPKDKKEEEAITQASSSDEIVEGTSDKNGTGNSSSDTKETTEVVERPSGMFPNYDAIAAAEEAADNTPVHTLDEEITLSPVKDLVKTVTPQGTIVLQNDSSSFIDHNFKPAVKTPRTYAEKIQLLKSGAPLSVIKSKLAETKSKSSLSPTEEALHSDAEKINDLNSKSPKVRKKRSLLSEFLVSPQPATNCGVEIIPPLEDSSMINHNSQHKLLFEMKLWVFPSKKPLPAVTSASERVNNPRPSNNTKGSPNWVIDFKYEVYYAKIEGVYYPHHFKLLSKGHSALAEKSMLHTVQERLRSEKAQIWKQLNLDMLNPTQVMNPLGDSLSKIVLQNSIICSCCETLIPTSQLLSHFTMKHMMKCVDCNEFVASPDSLFNHLVTVHGSAMTQCSICNRKFTKCSTFICKHRFTCLLCKRNFREYEMLIKHEEEHYRAIINLSDMFERLHTLPADIEENLTAMKQDMVGGACAVCGNHRVKDCSHTFSCFDCSETVHNYLLSLRHRCKKPCPTKPEPRKPIMSKLVLSCALCFHSLRCDENEYRLHYEKCLHSLLLKPLCSAVLIETNAQLLPVRCALCFVIFSTMVEFYGHYFTCFRTKTFVCDVCMEIVFIDQSQMHSCKPTSAIATLSKHKISRFEINLDVTPLYECYVCTAGFSDSMILSHHFKTAHSLSDTKCPACTLSFDSHHIWPYIQHLQQQHKSTPMKEITLGDETKAEYQCDDCGRFFKSHLSKLGHIVFHHPDKLLFCRSCQEQFVTMEALQAHKLTCTSRKEWVCKLCDKRFTNLKNFQQHSVIHFRALSCMSCKIVFKSRTFLGIHRRVAHPEKSFVCKFCLRVFVFAESLTQHYKTVHEEDIHCCSNCYKTFSSEVELSAHVTEHGISDCFCNFCSKKRTQPPVVFYSCDTCCETFELPLDLYAHNLEMHPNSFPHRCTNCGLGFRCNKAYQVHIAECVNMKADGVFYLCENCGESFPDQVTMEKHSLMHENLPNGAIVVAESTATHVSETALEPATETNSQDQKLRRLGTVLCPLCDKPFGTHNCSALLRHCRAHDPIQMVEILHGSKTDVFKCTAEHCNKRFSSNVPRFLHEIYHHNVPLYQCEVCYSEFNDYPAWKSHEKRCLEDYKKEHQPNSAPDATSVIPCKHCKEVFTDQTTLIAHKNLVHNVTSFILCRLCDKSFADQASLIAHKNAAHCDRSFECDICHRVYSCQAYLISHKRNIHTKGDYLCQDCGKKFTSRKYFREHVSKHASANRRKVFSCRFCDMAMLSAAGLKNHERSHSKRRNLMCHLCPRKFLVLNELRRHRKDEHRVIDEVRRGPKGGKKKGGKYLPLMNYCKVCNVYFSCLKNLSAHCEGPTDDGTFVCDFADCNLKFKDECSLNYHKRGHITGHYCELCGKSFTSMKVHRLHCQLEHNSMFPIHCEHCNRGFRSAKYLKTHNHSCNPNLGKLSSKSSNKENDPGKKKAELFSCNHCSKQFRNRQDLSIHFKCAHKDLAVDETSYTCKICGSSHSGYASLMNHTRLHYRSPNVSGFCCPICGFSNNKLQKLINHNCTVSGDHQVVKLELMKREADDVSQQEMDTATDMIIEEYIPVLSEDESTASSSDLGNSNQGNSVVGQSSFSNQSIVKKSYRVESTAEARKYVSKDANAADFCCPICGLRSSKLETLINHNCNADGDHQAVIEPKVKKRKVDQISYQEMDVATNMVIEEYVPALVNEESTDLASSDHENSSVNQTIINSQSIIQETIQETIQMETVVEDANYFYSEPDEVLEVHLQSGEESVLLDEDFIYVCSFCDSISFESITLLQAHLSETHSLNLKDLELQLVS